jgi:hypothetical protein
VAARRIFSNKAIINVLRLWSPWIERTAFPFFTI